MQAETYPSQPEASINSDSDVLIVGAGPGGLACSLLLAKAGLNVKILEKTDRVGGRTKVIEKMVIDTITALHFSIIQK